MTHSLGIDISRHQWGNAGQSPDWVKVRATTKYIAIRAGISWGYKDDKFDIAWHEMRNHNRMAYHVLYPGEDGRRQMDWFLSIVKPAGKDRLVMDLELDHGYSKSRITDTVLTCLEYLKTKTGKYPVIYSRAYWVNDYLEVHRLPPTIEWWLANYRTANPSPQFTPELDPPPMLPRGVTNWLIHQTADKQPGSKFGVASYYVDTDRWNGSDAVMQKWFDSDTHNVYLPIITKPEPEPVEDDWTGLLKVELWSQKDPRWANDRMGSSYFTLAQKGCLVDCVAIYLHYLGVDTDPKRYNQLLSIRGGYQYVVENGILYANMYWKYPGVLYPDKIAKDLTDYVWYANGTGWENRARAILNSKRPVLGLVDIVPGGALNQHWVLIVGQRSDGWWAVDPDTGTLINLAKYGNKVYRLTAYRRK